MFFEEKIEWLKKEFSASDFRVPYTHATDILKSIEKSFIIRKDVSRDLVNLGQYFNNWKENIKHEFELMTIQTHEFEDCLRSLNIDTNYWVVLESSKIPKNFIADCRPISINPFYCTLHDYLFIVEKKYEWFVCFQNNKLTQTIRVSKSGSRPTPFDELINVHGGR